MKDSDDSVPSIDGLHPIHGLFGSGRCDPRNMVPYDAALARFIGDREALVFRQLARWFGEWGGMNVGPDGRERLWTRRSWKDWRREFQAWSRSELREVVESLQEQNLILVRPTGEGQDESQAWYTYNLKAVEEVAQRVVDFESEEKRKRNAEPTPQPPVVENPEDFRMAAPEAEDRSWARKDG